jgi:hypothetical protein
MPIPPFDSILNILPPHLGNPCQKTDLSPYSCTIEEICDRFATSDRRKEILEGLLSFREKILGIGVNGFQWLGGSFLEDIEAQEGRDPGDIDAVTFVAQPGKSADLLETLKVEPQLLKRAFVKSTFHTDHYWVPLESDPPLLVSNARYWYGLFSHRRDQQWKGMLVVDLVDLNEDQAARTVLANK